MSLSIHDCHAHLDSADGAAPSVELLRGMCTTHLMSTNEIDFPSVNSIAFSNPHMIPYYGIHPWYAHRFYIDPPPSKAQFYSAILDPAPPPHIVDALPAPLLLAEHLAVIDEAARARAAAGQPFGVGEIGLDRSFTVPRTASHVSVVHQLRIFSALVGRAMHYRCPILVHGVKAHQLLYDALVDCPVPIVLHLFSGLADLAKAWMKRHANVYFSLLAAVNLRSLKRVRALLGVVKPHCLLVETDRIITNMSADTQQQYLWLISQCIRDAYQWDDDEVVRVLQDNANRLLQFCNRQK